MGFAVCVGTQAQVRSIIADAPVGAEWIAKSLNSSGYKADFSVASLKEVDRFIQDAAPNGEPKPGGLLSKDFGNRVFALGCYVGEVIRRSVGGEWKGNDDDPMAEINLELHLKDGSTIWPIQRIMKRIKNGEEDSVFAYAVAITNPRFH
jgi:hypothetical protein